MRYLALAVCLAFSAANAEASGDSKQYPRTDPQTWSAAGWLGFRFGMGPGDVYAVLRDPNSEMQARTEWGDGDIRPGFSHAYMLLDSSYSLLGYPVVATFTFARGRLVDVFLMQAQKLSQMPVEQVIEEGKAWGARLYLKYADEFGEAELGDLGWTWISGQTRIRVSVLGGVGFTEAAAFDAAEAEGKAAEAAKRRDVVAGKLTSMPEKTWAPSGWGRLRWGMGPADVAKVIAPARLVPAGDGEVNKDSLSLKADLNDTLYGRYIRCHFRFEKNKLVTVYVSDQHADDASNDSARTWLARIEDGLRKKYGEGKCSEYQGYESCRWRAKGGANIIASGSPTDGHFRVGLYYEDARRNAVEEQRERSEMDKL